MINYKKAMAIDHGLEGTLFFEGYPEEAFILEGLYYFLV